MALKKTSALSLFALTYLPSIIMAITVETKTELEYMDTRAIQAELNQLKSRLSKLESSIGERINELGNKDHDSKNVDKLEPEKSDIVLSVQNEVEYAQKWSQLLWEQLSAITFYLAPDFQSLLDTISEVYYALRVSSVHHMASIPHRLSVQINHLKPYAGTHWYEHGRPAMNLAVHKVLEKGSQFQKWAEPYIETTKTEWIPIMKNYMLALIAYLEQHVQSLSGTTTEFYDSFKSSTLIHHVVTMQDIMNPYFQQAKKKAEPYINHIMVATTPIIDGSRAALRPYTKNIVDACRKVIKYATVQFFQVKETLETNEMTKHLAALSPPWSMATASLALPVIYLVILFRVILSRKTKKQSRASNTKSKGRRSKRRYQDM